MCLDFEVRCNPARVWIQKKLISLLVTTITPNDPPARRLCARLKSTIRAAGNAGLPYPQLIGQIARQEMRMVRD